MLGGTQGQVNLRARLEEPTHIVWGIGHAEARLIE